MSEPRTLEEWALICQTAEELVRCWWNDTCRKLDLRDPDQRRPALRELARAIDAYASQQVEAWKEKATKALCLRCREVAPIIVGKPFNITPPMVDNYYHVEKGGAYNGDDLWWECEARQLRALPVETP